MPNPHLDLTREDTICALATPLAPAALAVVRVSGPLSAEVRSKIFRSHRAEQKDFMATLGYVVDPETGARLDEALCTFFPEGKSFTGEASFEISLHGNPTLVHSTLKVWWHRVVAWPDRASLRCAFLTGKIDFVRRNRCWISSVQAPNVRPMRPSRD